MNWETSKISNLLAKVKRSGKLQASQYQKSGRFPVIDQGVNDVAGFSDDPDIVHKAPLPIVIFGDHTRRVKLVQEPFICGADGTQLLYPKDERLDPVFFYHAVKNIDLSNYAYARNFKFLKEQELSYPDLLTQKRIAAILSAYDDLIENNRRRIALLEQAARLLYREWLVHFRFPGHETTKFVDGLPERWEIKHVKELLSRLKAKPQVRKDEYETKWLYPCVDQGQSFVGGYTNKHEAIYRNELPLIVFGDHTRSLKYVDFPFARGAYGTQIIQSNDDRLSQAQFYFALINVDLSNYAYARHFKFLKDQEIIVPD